MRRNRWIALLLAGILLLSLTGCSLLGLGGKDDEPDDEEMEEEYDPEFPVAAGGIVLQSRPGRVVSLAPALTEKLYDLDMEERLVGRSEGCDYPSAVTSLPSCGTAQLPDLERILELDPHLVLAAADLPDEAVETLEANGIAVAVLERADTVDGLLETYRVLAQLMEGQNTGALLGQVFAEDLRQRLDSLSGSLQSYTAGEGKKKVLFLRLLDYTVATGESFEQELLDLICVENIAQGQRGWVYSKEEAESAAGREAFTSLDLIYCDPDYVSITSLEGSDIYKGLPAVIQDRYHYFSGIAFERQSLRMVDELAAMAAAAYPDANISVSAPSRDRGDSGRDDLPDDIREQLQEGDDMVAALDDLP